MQNNSKSIDYHNHAESPTYRNWTYTLPDMDGQVLTTVDGVPSFKVSLPLDSQSDTVILHATIALEAHDCVQSHEPHLNSNRRHECAYASISTTF